MRIRRDRMTDKRRKVRCPARAGRGADAPEQKTGLQKNDVLEVKIEDLSSEGLGIGHYEGLAVFVKDTVIGDVVRAKVMSCKKNLAFARVEEILESSPDCVEPRCPIARPCGGCQIQMMDYAAQLAFKEERVRSVLSRIGGFDQETIGRVFEPVLGMEEPWRYRNKAQFPIGKDREGGIIAGFYAGRTHSIIPCEDCLLGIEENREILSIVLEHMRSMQIEPYDESTGTGLVRHVFTRKADATGQIMTVLVVNGKKLPGERELCSKLQAIPGMTAIILNENTQRTNVILGKEERVLWGQPYIEDLIGDIRFRISAHSFFQVNPAQTRKLYGKALEFASLTGTERVWDLYCGIGTISLFLARSAGRVRGVEIVPEAIDDARENARLNGITNAEFFVGKAEEVVPREYGRDGEKADVIVVDPPRKGCDETLLQTMASMAPERIVYVSCDPATLARDLKFLCANGYELKRVQPCDMFGHSVHVETVVLMERVHD